jgi:hypothetical protein
VETFPIVEARQGAAEPVTIMVAVIGLAERPSRFPTQQLNIVNTPGEHGGRHRAAQRARNRDFGANRRQAEAVGRLIATWVASPGTTLHFRTTIIINLARQIHV